MWIIIQPDNSWVNSECHRISMWKLFEAFLYHLTELHPAAAPCHHSSSSSPGRHPSLSTNQILVCVINTVWAESRRWERELWKILASPLLWLPGCGTQLVADTPFSCIADTHQEVPWPTTHSCLSCEVGIQKRCRNISETNWIHTCPPIYSH